MAGFCWLNNEEIHIVGCLVYLENYIKIIIRSRNVFLISVYFFICSHVVAHYCVSEALFALFSRDAALTLPSPRRTQIPKKPLPLSPELNERLETLYFYT